MTRQDPTPLPLQYLGYGDESLTDEAIVYSVAIFSIEKQAAAEAALCEAKQSVGLSTDDRIHCRSMFGNMARAKTCWSKVEPKSITSMIERLCETLAAIQERPFIFVAPRSWLNIAPLEPEGQPTSLDEKGIASIGFDGIHAHLFERYGYGAINVWIDPDSSKIPWFDGRRRQAHNTKGTFIDLGSHIEPPRISPKIGAPKTHRLLEIADLYAYISVQATSKNGGWKNRWCRELLLTIEPELLRFEPAPGTEQTILPRNR